MLLKNFFKNILLYSFSANDLVQAAKRIKDDRIVADKNHKFSYSDKTPVEIKSEIKKGGEGSLYHINESGMVAKIFSSVTKAAQKQRKIEYMVANNPHIDGLCWPEKLIFSAKGDFAGYVMPEFEGSELTTSVLKANNQYMRAQMSGSWQRKELVSVCLKIAELEAKLQKNGIKVGDVNSRNIMVNNADPNKLAFVDCDSYEFGEFKCTVGTPEYVSPYIIDRIKSKNIDFKNVYRDMDDENYAFAVLFLQILMLDYHPMDKLNHNNNIIEAIKNHSFAFEYKDISLPEHSARGLQQRIWHNMDDDVKNAFARTFKAYRVYSMDEWINLFEKYIEKLEKGECDNEISPEKYVSRFSGEYKNIKCYICNQNRNILRTKFEEMDNNKTIIYCDDCAFLAEDWKKEVNSAQKECDKCGKTEKSRVR